VQRKLPSVNIAGGCYIAKQRADFPRKQKLSNYFPYILSLAVVGITLIVYVFARRQMGQALKECELSYRALADFTSDWEYWIMPDGTFRYISPSCERISGYSPAEFYADPHLLPNIIHPDDLPLYVGHVHNLSTQGDQGLLDFRIYTKSGELRWISHVCHPVLDAAGRHTGNRASNRNVTEYKEAQAALQASEARLRVMLENDLVGIATVKDRIIQWVNPAYEKALGYEKGELNGVSVRILYASDEAYQAAGKKYYPAIDSGELFRIEQEFQCKDGNLITVNLNGSMLNAATGESLWIFVDITEKKKYENEIKQLAFFDPLTGLSNRRLLTDRMERALAQARRNGELVAVCMIDLDGFKQVNDRMGHKAGDQLLIEVARRLPECIRETDSASRFGGDEFAVLLSGFTKISECELSLKRVIASLAAPYLVGNEIAHVTASVGATIFPNDGGTSDLLLRHADQAMYEAKQAGKNCYRFFNPSQESQQLANQATIKKIGKALTSGQLILFYQPQVNCREGKVIGLEALIRWNHPILGILAPSEFIPLLEHDDLVITVGEWVIQEALRQLAEWRAAGIILTVSVNVSARQLHQDNFVERLQELLAAYDADVISSLTIEIVETAALENVDTVADAIRQCRALGIHVAIDDFGTGFSSLAHLKHLSVDVLKIDQSFIFGMLRNPGDLAIVSGVIGLASSFRHKVVAEGVESTDHILMLMEMGCDIMQGYVIARPMSGEKMSGWLRAFTPDPLWQLSGSQRPSRNYFELLLAETNHRHGINQQLESCSDNHEANELASLQNHRQCHFGDWYYGDGLRQFAAESWFRSLESVHQNVHQTAARLCEYKHTGKDTQSEEAKLLALQDELDALFHSSRRALADKYLLINPTQLKGEAK
jgi:diguanylate cyclase (GGDEF)-like protein/PAS domain S-box-containing protein